MNRDDLSRGHVAYLLLPPSEWIPSISTPSSPSTDPTIHSARGWGSELPCLLECKSGWPSHDACSGHDHVGCCTLFFSLFNSVKWVETWVWFGSPITTQESMARDNMSVCCQTTSSCCLSCHLVDVADVGQHSSWSPQKDEWHYLFSAQTFKSLSDTHAVVSASLPASVVTPPSQWLHKQSSRRHMPRNHLSDAQVGSKMCPRIH
jgi:hypothetical protein